MQITLLGQRTEMKKTEILAYAAGIVDGEGCITILNKWDSRSKTYDKVQVDITNTNEWICQWFKMQFGGTVRMCKAHKSNWKPTFKWILEADKATAFLKIVLPYLNIKKANAEIAISYQVTRRIGGHYSQDEKILLEADRVRMKQLNKKGV